MEKYVKDNKIDWPVLVDTDRRFERQSGVEEISLENIYQVKLVTSDGAVKDGYWHDIPASVQLALPGAKWKIDPSKVPKGLQAEWRKCEFGELPATEAVSEFEAAVNAAIAKDASRFWAIGKRGNRENAYRAFVAMRDRFQGYPIPARVSKAGQWLERHPELQDFVEAEKKKLAAKKEAARRVELSNKALRYASRLLSADTEDAQKRASMVLRRITKDYPETEAASEARGMLEKMKGS